MNTPDYFKGRMLQTAFCATFLLLMIPSGHAVDGYVKDASNGCAIFKPNLMAGETVTFKGPCANAFGEGRGVAKWSASDGATVTFEGNFVQGKLQGNGKMTASGGDRYEGEYKDGKREGSGVYTSANGDRFNGQYKDNQRNGQGILTLATGSVSVGEWRNGNPAAVTSRSSSGVGSAGPKLGTSQPSAAAPQALQENGSTAPKSGTAGIYAPRTSRLPTRPELSTTTGAPAEKIGLETVAASGSTLRVERCGRLVKGEFVPATSVVVVKIPKSIDLQHTAKTGHYNSSQMVDGVLKVLIEALDNVETHCQVKSNPYARSTDVYVYINHLPPLGTDWPITSSRLGQLDPKPTLIAVTEYRRQWRVQNFASDAYMKDQQVKQQEQQVKQQEQLRMAQLSAIAEGKKKELDLENAKKKRLMLFFNKHSLVDKDTKGLVANPFAFEGDRLFLVAAFEQMQSATTGVFYTNEGVFVLTDIPKGIFVTKERQVLLAAKVLGNVRFDGVVGGLLPVNGMVPNLKYLGAIVCQDPSCNEMKEK